MFSSAGTSPYQCSWDTDQFISLMQQIEEEDLRSTVADPSLTTSTPESQGIEAPQAAQQDTAAEHLDEEGFTISSNIEWTPDFVFLLRQKEEKALPDCFDVTPMKVRLSKVYAIQSDDEKFLEEFTSAYYELGIHMEFSDQVLLDYSASQRADLLVLINVFIANLPSVKEYQQGYDDLLTQLHDRFGLKKEFQNYFPQYSHGTDQSNEI